MAVLDIQLVDSSFELVRRLTRSGQADIYLARTKNHSTQTFESFVFKAYKDSPQAIQAMENEQVILNMLYHCGVSGVPIPMCQQPYQGKGGGVASRLLNFLLQLAGRPREKKRNGMLYRFLEGGDLETLLGADNTRFEPGKVAEWTEKLCETLGRVHKQEIVHGDIKPGNLMWNEKHKVLWLIDFGSAVSTGTKAQQSLTLTREYASPQLLAGENPSPADDIYAVGVTLFVLLAGARKYPVDVNWRQIGKDHPDSSEQTMIGLERLKSGLETLDVEGEFEKLQIFEGGQMVLRERFARVIQKCLAPQPGKRYQRAVEIVEDLNPPGQTLTSPVTAMPGAQMERREPVPTKFPIPAPAGIVPPPPLASPGWGRLRWAFLILAMAAILAVAAMANLTKLHNIAFWKTTSKKADAPMANSNRSTTIATPADIGAKFPVEPSKGAFSPVIAASPPAKTLDVSPTGPAKDASTAPAKFDPKGDHFVNSLGMEFVPVGVASERRQIWFCACQTSVANFNDYLKSSASRPEICPQLQAVLNQEADLPVRDVTWEQARQFCEWLSRKDQALGVRYRLPSDAEWSAAAGLPPETGQTPAEREPAGLGHQATETAAAEPVASGQPNANRLYHIGDNVAEWCGDVYSAQGDKQTMTYRGVYGRDLHYRGRAKLFDLQDSLGFRCVAEAVPDSGTVAASGNPGANSFEK